MRRLTLICVALLLAADNPPPPEPHWTATAPVATNIRVHDGDTITADIELPWGVSLRQQSIRAADFDAWEVSRTRRTIEFAPDETTRGRAARDDLAKWIAAGRLYVVPAGRERDVYGRVLATWWIAEPGGQPWSVARRMAEMGHTRKVVE